VCASIWGSERTAGRGLAWFKAPHWGCGDREFKSPRPDSNKLSASLSRTVLSDPAANLPRMAENISDKRTWSDSQLVAAVAASRSWRGVMRELGLCVTSAGSIQMVKRHVIRLGLGTAHFTGQRRWSDAQLKRAITNPYPWREAFTDLGLLVPHQPTFALVFPVPRAVV
jgi:hypothetical protein